MAAHIKAPPKAASGGAPVKAAGVQGGSKKGNGATIQVAPEAVDKVVGIAITVRKRV